MVTSQMYGRNFLGQAYGQTYAYNPWTGLNYNSGFYQPNYWFNPYGGYSWSTLRRLQRPGYPASLLSHLHHRLHDACLGLQPVGELADHSLEGRAVRDPRPRVEHSASISRMIRVNSCASALRLARKVISRRCISGWVK